MRRLWHRTGPATVRDLVTELQEEREIAYTTVMTVLHNLYKKGWLRREADGRAYRYEAVHSSEEYGAQLMQQALDSSPDRVATFVHFLRQMTAAEIQELEAAYRRVAQADEQGDSS